MADPRRATSSARLAMTLAAVAGTLGGWLALAMRDAPPAPATDTADVERQVPPVPALPTLEPVPTSLAPESRRPKPIATTRSSR